MLRDPFCVEVKMIHFPSGVQRGFKSSPESNVSLEMSPRSGCINHRSRVVYFGSAIATTRRSSPGEKDGPEYLASWPIVPSCFPVRSNHVNCVLSGSLAKTFHASTPFSEAENTEKLRPSAT